MARAIRLINSLLDGENENIPKIHLEFPYNFQKIIFHEISPKSFSQGFLLIFKFSENENIPKILLIFKFSENKNIPKIHREFPDNFRKIIFHEISPKSFSQGFLLIFKFSKNCPKTHLEFPEK